MRSLTLLALYIFMPQSGAVELTEMYGSIQSPNFPDSYPKNSEVSWNITVPEGFKIKLYFMHFDLEPSYLCEYDYVKIEAEQELLVIFCGRENTDTEQIPGEQVIMSPENSLSVSFRSDFSNEERFTGFEAHYTAVDVDECTERNDEELACDHYCHNYIGGYYCSCRFGYILHSDNRTCRVECSDNLFIERTGVITSSDFPNPYPKSSDCLYRIELQEGFMISLEFDDSFDIEDHPEVTCPYDYLKIKAGRREFGPLCGERSPGRIETGSNSVQILFHSDNSGESRGWKLSYTAVGNPCPVPQPPKNGKIEPVLAQYSFKDQVLITCDTGYNVLKDDIEAEHYQIECRKEGTWSSNVPVCKIVDCGAPVELEHGSVSSDSGDNLTIFGSSIQYSCQGPRYHMYPAINNSTYICGEKGLWVNEELGSKRPSCMAVCGAPQFSRVKRQRVANGHSATRGVSPWIAMLSRNGQPFCGGSLIGNKWIVTAAHCLLDPLHSGNPVPVTVSAASFQIILGKHRTKRKDDTEQTLQAEQLILHPAYQAATFEFDIALLQLSRPATFNNYVLPVCLPDESQHSALHEGDMMIVSGWGKQFLRRLPDSLMEIEIPIANQELCKTSYKSLNGKVTDDMLCAGEKEGGKDACQGDSGGPMVTLNRHTGRWFLAAVVSWGDGCGVSGRFGVYSNVVRSLSWIRNITGVENV
ncbi:mannan-binding lectin serine protease 1-like isoform X2 [Acipenser ruthenus]|uniref:mannan-binding lectin serine protease 1-like isoform X2 n=1 Tax=Acipenser ruthenus TaxID=7906 RepID=UPI002740DDFD|nr:mannan-binding lectin serine protease 1-like isoform X2 [Acipenser ruthenus]